MKSDRRRFMIDFGSTILGATTVAALRPATAIAASDTVTVALIGCGGQGQGLAKRFKSTPNVRVAYVCDVDKTNRDKAQVATEAPNAVEDLRRVLDDRSVDAVVVATPDHWHTPAAILAMEAGKHVYLEKPCCQNFREGLLLCEVAQCTKKVFQHGTQFRSDPTAQAVIAALRTGIIGDVLMSKAWNIQRRNSIGHEKPSAVPAGVNYDLWVGPAEFVPFQSNRFHYNWRWWHNFGSGDMGNDGVHELDVARWGLGVESLPDVASGVGGKYFFDDDQQFPDTMTVAFEYTSDPLIKGRRTLIYEQRLWSTNYPFNVDSGVEFYGTKGKIFLSKRGKLELLGERNERLEFPMKPVEGGLTHYQDFVQAILDGHKPKADVQTAFRSAALSHLGNLVVRLGRSVKLDSTTMNVINDPEAEKLLGRSYRDSHWAIPQA